MNNRMKFHLLAITTICITVILVFNTKKPPEQAPQAEPLSSRFVIVHSASWGLNCNGLIQQAIEEYKTSEKKPVAPAAAGQPAATPAPEPTLAKENNAIMAMTDLCTNKVTCTFQATEALFGRLGVRCFKNMEIGYRCFEFDRIRYAEGKQDKEITLDCSEPENAASDTTTTPQP